METIDPGAARSRCALAALVTAKRNGALRQQSVHHQRILRARVDFAVGHHRHGELHVSAQGIARGVLAAVPEFVGQVARIESTQHVRRIEHPGDGIARAVGRNRGQASGRAEPVAAETELGPLESTAFQTE